MNVYEIRSGKTKIGYVKKASTALVRARSAASWRKKAVRVLKAGKPYASCKRVAGKVVCQHAKKRRRRRRK